MNFTKIKHSWNKWKTAFQTYEMSDVTRGLTYGLVWAFAIYLVQWGAMGEIHPFLFMISLLIFATLEVLGTVYVHKETL